jgi:transketolase
MHEKAKVGHLGGNISCFPGLYSIFKILGKRDRFIMSKGHSAGALYVGLAMLGKIPISELESFHKDGTNLPGHPPANKFDEIPFATGSLGHGLSLAAGFALSQKLRGDPSKTYCLTSDGEWQEGSTWEALIFICHHQLKNITIVIDHNQLQGFGSTMHVASMNPLWEKLVGFPLLIEVLDGHDLNAIAKTLDQKQDCPRAIFLQTTKGKGIPNLEGKMESHYLPLTNHQYQAAVSALRDHP